MHAGTTAELVFDRAQALESLGGDEELLANVASLFVDEAVSYRQALIDALAAGDAATLQREAHTVKSVLATFAYEAGRERALRLEQLAASGNLEAAKAATDEVIARGRITHAEDQIRSAVSNNNGAELSTWPTQLPSPILNLLNSSV